MNMICPHCGVGVSIDWENDVYKIPSQTKDDEDEKCYSLASGFCPECNGYIVYIQKGEYLVGSRSRDYIGEVFQQELIFPKYSSQRILDNSIPEKYLITFREAEQVINISPKASATLGRYLLQLILHEELKIKKRNLEEEINVFADAENVPSQLVTMLQVMRKVANFGAHPKKSTNCNEIVEVQTGEAEIMLDVITEMFDFIFVKPKKKQEFLNHVKEKYGIEV